MELEISELVTEYHDAYDFAYLAKVLVLSFAQCPHRIFSSEKNKNCKKKKHNKVFSYMSLHNSKPKRNPNET